MLYGSLFLPMSMQAGDRGALPWLSWTALQAIPSPTFTVDRGHGEQQRVTSFRWQITPISYSWSANELVSPVSYLKVNPIRRHAGSAEFFVQPEVAVRDYQFAGLSRSSLGIGSRAFLPVVEYGEYLSVSLGAKYIFRRSINGDNANAFAGEIGLYTYSGLIGLQLGVEPEGRYSLSIYLKYY